MTRALKISLPRRGVISRIIIGMATLFSYVALAWDIFFMSRGILVLLSSPLPVSASCVGFLVVFVFF